MYQKDSFWIHSDYRIVAIQYFVSIFVSSINLLIALSFFFQDRMAIARKMFFSAFFSSMEMGKHQANLLLYDKYIKLSLAQSLSDIPEQWKNTAQWTKKKTFFSSLTSCGFYSNFTLS